MKDKLDGSNIIIHEGIGKNMSTNDCSNSFNDRDVVNALRRAIVQGDQDAQMWVQHHLGNIVRDWLQQHPNREAACRLESEEYYVAGAFERFWQLTTDQQLEFNTLTKALPYLLVGLQGTVLDKLRIASYPKETSLPGPGLPKELLVKSVTSSIEVWELLQRILLDVREQRLAYLLFHCGLSPQEIVHFRSQEFGDIHEIYRLRCDIIERIARSEVLSRVEAIECTDW
jgi:hypothetical protein